MLYTRAVLSLYALLCCVVAPMSPVHEDGRVDGPPTRDDAERQREVVRASWQERQHAAPNDTPERPQGVVRPSLRQEDAVEQNDGRRVRRRLEGTLVTQYSTCTVCGEDMGPGTALGEPRMAPMDYSQPIPTPLCPHVLCRRCFDVVMTPFPSRPGNQKCPVCRTSWVGAQVCPPSGPTSRPLASRPPPSPPPAAPSPVAPSPSRPAPPSRGKSPSLFLSALPFFFD